MVIPTTQPKTNLKHRSSYDDLTALDGGKAAKKPQQEDEPAPLLRALFKPKVRGYTDLYMRQFWVLLFSF